MGYFPIFLYLASFIFLFLLVVNNSVKNKKKQYRSSLEELVSRLKGYLGTGIAVDTFTLEEAEQQYRILKSNSDLLAGEKLAQLNEIKLLLGSAKQQRYWYNNLIKTKPYSFVARLFGHGSL